MTSTGGRVRQHQPGTRAPNFVRKDESSDGHTQNLTGTSAASNINPKRATIACKAELPAFSLANDPEGAEGAVVRFDSQQFLDLVKYGSRNEDSVKKANRYFEEFKKTIETQGKGLESELVRQNAQSSSQGVEFSTRFGTACSLILHNNAGTQTPAEQVNITPSRSCNILHQRSTNVLSSAAALIELLQKSCREMENHHMSSVADSGWQEDVHKMKRVLDLGRQLGEQKVESILTAAGNPMLDAQTAEISQLLYDKQSQPIGDLTWDQAAKKQEKAVMRLVSVLPWE